MYYCFRILKCVNVFSFLCWSWCFFETGETVIVQVIHVVFLCVCVCLSAGGV